MQKRYKADVQNVYVWHVFKDPILLGKMCCQLLREIHIHKVADIDSGDIHMWIDFH